MTKQNNQCRETVLLATIISIFLFGAFGSTFAQAKNSNLSAFYNLSSNANPNSLFNPTKEFDLTKIQPSNLFAANFKSADDYPKPDFSEIEKWYEIVKYEYGDLEGGDNTLNFWYKPKKKPSPWFKVEFRDQDGALVRDGSEAAFDFGKTPEVGEVSKGYSGTPFEKEMKKVVSVKFIRYVH